MTQDLNKLDILKDIFNVFNIPCNNEPDLLNITLDFDTLKDSNIITKLSNLIPKYKTLYNTSMLTCLHQNSTDKQNYKLHGYYISLGYNKLTGKKILKRLYKIIPLE